MTRLEFPTGFVWGAATSAYQVEGAVEEDGRGPSIWDRFSHGDGNVTAGHTGDVTADHYHRWAEDVDLMAGLNLTAYRFSISWPRVVPAGDGRVNAAGIAFYDRLVDRLLERGIAPCPTLYHWDLPAWADDAGGWLERSTADRFGEYAAACFEALGDRVGTWFTINEPWVAATLGYRLGIHAPGQRDLGAAVRASHHLLLAHGRAVAAWAAAGNAPAGGRIGLAPNLLPTYPASDSAADRDAARGSDGYTNRWFLDPVMKGRYPEDTFELLERLTGPLDVVRDGDMAAIGAPTGVLGVNYYTSRVVRAAAGGGLPWSVDPVAPGTDVTEAGWAIVPDALADVLRRLRDEHPAMPLLVTENGAVYHDQPDPTGRVADAGRISFLRRHLEAIHAAIADGVRVEGYFHWSLLDNFEWADGFRPRYGLVHVDYPTGRRLVKDSGHWYAAVIAANAIPGSSTGPTAGQAAGATAGAADVG